MRAMPVLVTIGKNKSQERVSMAVKLRWTGAFAGLLDRERILFRGIGIRACVPVGPGRASVASGLSPAF